MFGLGDTVAIYAKSDTDDVPVGQGTLTATSPKYEYELRDLRWRASEMTRTRMWFDVATRVEAFKGQYMVRPECHARDSNLLAKWFPM